MPIKRILLSTVIAMGCAINFSFVSPVEAAPGLFGMVLQNAGTQESNARHWMRKKFNGDPQEGTSARARKYAPIVHMLQKRLCDANGLEITEERFRHTYDFNKKVHPVILVDAFYNGMSFGAGYICMGSDYIDGMTVDGANNYGFDYISIEKMIAHELSHAKKGHSVTSTLFSINNQFEKSAEKGSIEMMDVLPEGGWGGYLVAINHHMNRPPQNKQIMRSFEKQCKRKITIEGPTTVYYNASDGKKYGLWGSSQNDYGAYFGGQIAYCIAKGGLKLDNIQIIDNPLKDELHFAGENLALVCQDNSLPNGYRVLYGIKDMDKEKALKELSASKKIVQRDKTIGSYDDMKAAVYYNSFYIWLACAIAQDVEHPVPKK